MNGTLHDLARLYLYCDTDSSRPICKVYFGGKLEPYDTVFADELFGDLAIRDTKVVCIDSFDEIVFSDNNVANMNISDLAKTILYCYDDTEQYASILDLLNAMENNDLSFDREIFDAFVYSHGVYVPICYRFPLPNDFGEIDTELPYYEPESMLESIRKKPVSDFIYRYDCDTLGEIMMSLLHYFALSGKTIHRCARCGRWFSPQVKSDEKYCLRVYDNETCREIANAERRKARLSQQPLQKKYNSVNTKLATRVNALSIDFNERERRRQELYRFRNDWVSNKEVMSDEELMSWLNTFSFRK